MFTENAMWFLGAMKSRIETVTHNFSSVLFSDQSASHSLAHPQKTFQDVNYNDKALWSGIFNDALEELKDNKTISSEALQARLKELQGILGSNTLSLMDYVIGLQQLKKHFKDESLKSAI